jgi:hypothetical protein
MIDSRFIDAVIGLFGFGRIVIGEWSQKGVVSAAIREIEDAGGIAEKTYGTPDGQYDCTRFRLRGRWLRLCAEEMGEVTLFGPTRLITELSQRISRRLNDSRPR